MTMMTGPAVRRSAIGAAAVASLLAGTHANAQSAKPTADELKSACPQLAGQSIPASRASENPQLPPCKTTLTPMWSVWWDQAIPSRSRTFSPIRCGWIRAKTHQHARYRARLRIRCHDHGNGCCLHSGRARRGGNGRE